MATATGTIGKVVRVIGATVDTDDHDRARRRTVVAAVGAKRFGRESRVHGRFLGYVWELSAGSTGLGQLQGPPMVRIRHAPCNRREGELLGRMRRHDARAPDP